MKIVESILTKNPCYTAGRKITVKGLMLHSVGCNQPKASVFINSWNSASYDRACVHGFIDANDGTIYQTLPWNHRGWHCGSGSKGSGNNTHIGVEMCEPACIKYTGGSSFTCSDTATAKACAERTYQAAVELFAMLCKEYGLDPLADGVVISHKEGHSRGIASNHGDPEHLWTQLKMGYTMDTFRKAVKAAMSETTAATGLQAGALKDLSEAEVIAKVGPLFTADQKKTGILASVSLAQFILESGYGKSELAQNANNCFGMKKSLSGNTWGNSTWDGVSIYTKKTQEQNPDGSYETITADFRKYPCVEDSIADHSAYLLGAMNGSRKRNAAEPTQVWYRVRKTWADAKSQKGAFHVLSNAKACADDNPGYSVFDESGKAIYTGKGSGSQAAFQPYLVKVSITDLNIRKGPGTNYAKTGKYTGVGVFTIVEESAGAGSDQGWGLLKSYQSGRNGWVSLDYCKKL